MTEPIRFDPNSKINSEEKSKRGVAKPDRFNEILEDSSRKSAAQLKKHNKGLDAESEDLEEFGKVEEEESSSIFDLSASKKAKKEFAEELKRSHEEPLEKKSKEDEFIHLSAKSEKEKSNAVIPAPVSEGLSQAVSSSQVKAISEPATDLQELIKQITNHISEMRYAGKTETIVTLQHPPLFNGAKLVLTSFDSAKGEFNIAFENLSLKAKNFLDHGNHLNTLQANLHQKGYVAHIITATTTEETAVFEMEQTRYARGDDEPQDQRQGQQNQDNEEQET